MAEIEDITVSTLEANTLHRASIYVGSMSPIERTARVAQIDENGELFTVEKTILMPEGLERTSIETIANACDNLSKSRYTKHPQAERPTEVSMDSLRFSVKNYGEPMKIEQKVFRAEKGLEWRPYVAFGVPLSSSQYGKNIKTTSYDEGFSCLPYPVTGRNGLGSKLANVLSKYFETRLADGTLTYQQTFRENMTVVDSPLIGKVDPSWAPEAREYTHLVYDIDMRRFGYSEYTELDMDLIRMLCVNYAYTLRAPMSFNEYLIKPMNILEYTKLCFGKDTEIALGYVWDPKSKVVKTEVQHLGKTLILETAGLESPLGGYPVIEYAFVDTPNEGRFISFFNGIPMKSGGSHVEGVYKALGAVYLKKINKDTAEAKNRLTVKHLQRHVSLVVSYYSNERHDMGTNTKDKLTLKTFPKIEISETTKKVLNGFQFMECLASEMKLIHTKGLSSGKSRDLIGKIIDANKAGKKGHVCTLCLCEGDSARKYVMITTQDDRDHYGILPLRGKGLNALRAKDARIGANKEFQNITHAMGLVPGEDYTIDANYDKLRYKLVEIRSDEDSDGEHIRCLLMIFFKICFPSLLKRKDPIVSVVVTPLIARTKGKQRVTFYTAKEHEDWCKITPDSEKWDKKYYKGLGGWSAESAWADRGRVFKIGIDYRDEDNKTVQMAFGPDTVDRKAWIRSYDPTMVPLMLPKITMSQLILNRYIRYPIDSLQRMIPALDGLKQLHRKVISAFLLRWPSEAAIRSAGLVLTNSLLGYIMEHMDYGHGDASIASTLNRMVRDYVGTNNLPLIAGEGLFEDRFGNKATASRYTSMRPKEYLSTLINRDDLAITPRLGSLGDDKKLIEFEQIPTILPLTLINGIKPSMACGWLSRVFGGHYRDVARFFLDIIDNKLSPRMFKPYCRGFKGKVEVVKKDQIKETIQAALKEQTEKALQDPEYIPSKDEEVIGNLDADTFVIFTGSYRINPKTKIVTVTELPPGARVDKYKAWLDTLKAEKVIKSCDLREEVTKDSFEIDIKGFPDPNATTLRLRRIYSYSNMTLLDKKGLPVEYARMEDIAYAWYDERIQQIRKRLDYKIEKIGKEVQESEERRRFIQLVRENPTTFIGGGKGAIAELMTKHNFEATLLKNVNLLHCTEEKIAHLDEKVEKLKKEYEELKATTPQQAMRKDILQFLVDMKPYD